MVTISPSYKVFSARTSPKRKKSSSHFQNSTCNVNFFFSMLPTSIANGTLTSGQCKDTIGSDKPLHAVALGVSIFSCICSLFIFVGKFLYRKEAFSSARMNFLVYINVFGFVFCLTLAIEALLLTLRTLLFGTKFSAIPLTHIFTYFNHNVTHLYSLASHVKCAHFDHNVTFSHLLYSQCHIHTHLNHMPHAKRLHLHHM